MFAKTKWELVCEGARPSETFATCLGLGHGRASVLTVEPASGAIAAVATLDVEAKWLNLLGDGRIAVQTTDNVVVIDPATRRATAVGLELTKNDRLGAGEHCLMAYFDDPGSLAAYAAP